MGKNKNYLRGVALEREVVNLFRKNGWGAVRSAGSHSEYDVILWKKGEKIKKVVFVAFAQCKTCLEKDKPKKNDSHESKEPSFDSLSKLL